MTARPIRVIQPADTAKVVFGAGDEYRYLATGANTDGGYFLVEAVVPPGGGPPPHIQTREEEAFYILEGQLTFYGDEGEITAGPGTYLNIPKGAKHRFRNNTDGTVKMLFFFAPAGIEGLFDEFSKMDEPDAEPEAVFAALNTTGAKYGVQYFAG
jgi:quercetin dioxygenase-like cupin family protein